MNFGCSGCDYTSCNKHCIIRHMIRKIKCSEGSLNIIDIPLNINCEYCNKNFNTVPSMKRHLITCKIKKYKLETENKKLKNKILEIEKEASIDNKKLETKLLKVNNYVDYEHVVHENYIYILQEREFVKSDEHVYKLGITTSVKNRMGDYPKGSNIIAVFPVNGNPEKICLEKLRECFIPRKDIGSEYFEGNIELIVKQIIRCCYETVSVT